MGRILLFLVVGFGLNRLHILPEGAGKGTSRLVTTVLLPALLIYSNMIEFNLANVLDYGRLVLLGFLFWIVLMVVALPASRKLAKGDVLDRGVYLYGLSFSNTGAVGTPLALALFGTAGLFQLNLFMLSMVIATYAWGIGLFLGSDQKNPVKRFIQNLINPVFVSTVLGLTLGAIGAKNWMPGLAMNFLSDMGDCYIPVSLISAGYAIADYPLNEVFNRPRSYVFTTLRLIVIPAIAVGLAALAGLNVFEATLVVLAFAGPSGMNVVVFPASLGRDCKSGASIVLISSLGSILSVPLIYSLVQMLFG